MTKDHLAKAELLEPLMHLEMETLRAKKQLEKTHLFVRQKLRQYRIEAKLSVREVARRMGLSADYVSDVELGKRGVSIAFADDYMEALNGPTKGKR